MPNNQPIATDINVEPLAYARPMERSAATTTPDPVAAVVSCLPGLICWLVLGMVLVGNVTNGRSVMWMRPFGAVAPILVLLCWAVAILTAIGSLVCYVRLKPKPWYVVLNLVINITGLLFTGGIALIIAFAMASH